MTFLDIQQNTEEWFDARLGKATSSNFEKIMAYQCKKWGEGAKDYAQKIALEIATGKRDESASHSNKYMERGHEYEPIAIQMYEVEMFEFATNGGIFISDCGRFGDSPDANIGNGALEIKSVIPKAHWARLKTNEIDNKYFWQCQGHIWLGEKDWCDFVSFCPEMPENKQLFVKRIKRDEQNIKKLEDRLEEFWILVEENLKILGC